MGHTAASCLERHLLDVGAETCLLQVHFGVDSVLVALHHALHLSGVVLEGLELVGTRLTLHAVVDNVLYGLLALGLRLSFTQRRVHHLPVDALELAEVKKVNFDVLVFTKELTNKLEDV